VFVYDNIYGLFVVIGKFMIGKTDKKTLSILATNLINISSCSILPSLIQKISCIHPSLINELHYL
jgi:hypothetical protein